MPTTRSLFRARPAAELLEARLTPAQYSFAGFTFEQDSTPDVQSLLAPGTYTSAVVTIVPSSATGVLANFPDAPTTGFDPALSLGWLLNASTGPRAINLPSGNNGATQRSGVELAWSGNRVLQNAAGSDFVVYESGTVTGTAEPEAFMMQVRNALTGAWSSWYYTPATASAVTSGSAGLFATAYDLTDLGIGATGYIDRVRIVNMTDEDRMVSSTGAGAVIPEDNGATSTFLPSPGALASFANYGASTLDPDPAYVGVLSALSGPLVDVQVAQTDGLASVTTGGTVTYTITVTNAGPNAANGTTLTDVLPTGLTGATWASASSGGATGNTATGSGNISEVLNLPVGASVTYTLTGTVSGAAGTTLTNTVTATAPTGTTDLNTANNTATDTNNVAPVAANPIVTPAAVPVYLTAVGADANGHVKVYNQDGSLRFSFLAFAGFTGGVRVATGDVNGDSVDDIVVGAGPGAPGGHVKVFDGATGALLASFFSFEGFTGGVNVAVGDVDGDGEDDIIVGTGSGASHVKAFKVLGQLPDPDPNDDVVLGPIVYFSEPQLIASFLAFAPGYTGGVTVAAGNFDGAGADEIVVGAASAAGHVKVFGQAGNELLSFFAFGRSNGVTVAAGDLDGDGAAELVVGSGAGANGQVNVFAGKTGAARGSIAPIAGTNGARVATGFANSDSVLDILVGTGAGADGVVRSFDGLSLAPVGSFAAFDGFQGGLYVG